MNKRTRGIGKLRPLEKVQSLQKPLQSHPHPAHPPKAVWVKRGPLVSKGHREGDLTIKRYNLPPWPRDIKRLYKDLS